jgi:hypothetical protein
MVRDSISRPSTWVAIAAARRNPRWGLISNTPSRAACSGARQGASGGGVADDERDAQGGLLQSGQAVRPTGYPDARRGVLGIDHQRDKIAGTQARLDPAIEPRRIIPAGAETVAIPAGHVTGGVPGRPGPDAQGIDHRIRFRTQRDARRYRLRRNRGSELKRYDKLLCKSRADTHLHGSFLLLIWLPNRKYTVCSAKNRTRND